MLAGLIAAVCGVLLLSASAAEARPGEQGVAELRSRAATVRAEIARLDRRVAVAVEQYNQARVELNEVNVRLIEARRELARTEEQLDRAQIMLGERVSGVYKSEDLGLLDVLLAAGDLGDFSNVATHLSFLELMHGADVTAVTDLEHLTSTVQAIKDEIETERNTALSREMILRDRQADVEDQLGARKAVLADLDARLKRQLEIEARREAEAAKRLARQAGVDIDSINGSAAQLAVVRAAMKHLGTPYVWGGASPSGGFDCSGLVMYVYRQFDVDLLHGATLQARSGTPIPLSRMQPADLVFFGDSSFYRHVGIYIGDGLFIEAPRTGDVVKISKLAGRGCALACRYPIRLR